MLGHTGSPGWNQRPVSTAGSGPPAGLTLSTPWDPTGCPGSVPRSLGWPKRHSGPGLPQPQPGPCLCQPLHTLGTVLTGLQGPLGPSASSSLNLGKTEKSADSLAPRHARPPSEPRLRLGPDLPRWSGQRRCGAVWCGVVWLPLTLAEQGEE